MVLALDSLVPAQALQSLARLEGVAKLTEVSLDESLLRS